MSRMLEICILNLDANPHPPGIYVKSLTEASNYFVRSRANDWAKVTAPQKTSDENFYVGRILIWTEIDLNGKWLDTRLEDTLSEALKAEIKIPAEAKPNFRSFDYVLRYRTIVFTLKAEIFLAKTSVHALIGRFFQTC